MYDDTKFMLLLAAMMLPGIGGIQKQRTPEDEVQKARQDAAYDEWRRNGGDLSMVGAALGCQCKCHRCRGSL